MDEGMTVNFDFDQFYSLLYSASKSSFIEIQSRHPEDDFYYFALTTCGDLNDVFASAGSEEGLTSAARRYYEMGFCMDSISPTRGKHSVGARGIPPILEK
jgi:hypothetical protein